MDILTAESDLPADTLALDNTADVTARAAEIRSHAGVALVFPKWTDGRAYSQAVLLRGRVRYPGRLIATGEVLADMLPLLRRCGFDAVRLRADQNPQTARRTLGFDAQPYQGDATGRRAPFINTATA
jgi:uncharacterized protein (DUF934 family)